LPPSTWTLPRTPYDASVARILRDSRSDHSSGGEAGSGEGLDPRRLLHRVRVGNAGRVSHMASSRPRRVSGGRSACGGPRLSRAARSSDPGTRLTSGSRVATGRVAKTREASKPGRAEHRRDPPFPSGLPPKPLHSDRCASVQKPARSAACSRRRPCGPPWLR
jgi:hypothetical protein